MDGFSDEVAIDLNDVKLKCCLHDEAEKLAVIVFVIEAWSIKNSIELAYRYRFYRLSEPFAYLLGFARLRVILQ